MLYMSICQLLDVGIKKEERVVSLNIEITIKNAAYHHFSVI